MRTELHFDVAHELLTLGASVLLGILLAVLYRLFALLRLFFNAGTLLTAFFDLLYVALSLVLLFFFGFAFVGGEVRLYILCASALGFLICHILTKYLAKFFSKRSSILKRKRV